MAAEGVMSRAVNDTVGAAPPPVVPPPWFSAPPFTVVWATYCPAPDSAKRPTPPVVPRPSGTTSCVEKRMPEPGWFGSLAMT